MTQPASVPTAPRLPLFYQKPQPLSAKVHADWRLKSGDFAFAASTVVMPIVVGELAAAARNYPVVFTSGEVGMVALLGLEKDNLFVTQGRWADDAYVPAYARRYPFVFAENAQPQGFVLAIDAASDRIVRSGKGGDPLFEAGQPSALTQENLSFCQAFQGEATASQAFCEALKSKGLLIDRRADATLSDGRKLGLEGFQIVDAEAFNNLDDATVVDWHRKGWLALVQFHLASMGQFAELLKRQGERDESVSSPSAKPAAKPAKSRAKPN